MFYTDGGDAPKSEDSVPREEDLCILEDWWLFINTANQLVLCGFHNDKLVRFEPPSPGASSYLKWTRDNRNAYILDHNEKRLCKLGTAKQGGWLIALHFDDPEFFRKLAYDGII